MANEFYDLFNQLFYAQEIWGYLGLAGVLAFCFVVTYKVKEFAGLGFLICTFMALDYLGRQIAGGYYIWHSIIAFFGAVLLVIVGIDRFAHAQN